jgi:putative endonuclease
VRRIEAHTFHNRFVADRRALGAEHEDRAADFLLALGYTIVTRRFRATRGEVDIVAIDGETLVFVEVKFRNRGAPEEAVDHTKVRRFNHAVDAYLRKTGTYTKNVRYDLVAVTPFEIRHHKGAFQGA